MKIVILAGGGGTRLWPLSKQELPKQFLKIGGDQSLLQQTASRFISHVEGRDILISTSGSYEELVKNQMEAIQSLEEVSIVVEPAQRNTAPAIALSIRYLEEFRGISPDESILVLPSDHLIEPNRLFLDYLKRMESAVSQDKIVIFGIRPTKPDVGFGYLKISQSFDDFCYHVEEFVEKPKLELAQQFLAHPRYYWNSGMFVFSARTIWASFEEHLPQVAQMRHWSWEKCLKNFHELKDISIDYGLIEKAKNIVACPLPVTWSDVGSWDNVYEILPKDLNGNVKTGHVLDIDTKNCLILAGEKLISTIGLEDLIVIATEGAILISKKGQSQKVREIVNRLRDNVL